LDQEFIDAMIAQEDADALPVSTFEGEFEDFLQETPEMYEALTSYIEARSKLVEKEKALVSGV
jgi:glutaredoxin 2